MTTTEIANRLTALLKQGQFETAQKELFADDAISIEPAHSGQKDTHGIEAILEKGKQFQDMVEAFHAVHVSEAITSGQHIALALKVDLTFKGQEPTSMDEIIIYQVKEDKIIQEQFWY